MDLEILKKAISDHVNLKIQIIDKNTIRINEIEFRFSGSLIKSEIVSMRISGIRSFLKALGQANVISLPKGSIEHILNRYRHLNNVKTKSI
jgi:hypothetical protein